MLDRVGDFKRFLSEGFDEEAAYAPLRRAEMIGRPIGGRDWIEALELRTGRTLARQKPGPKAKDQEISKLSSMDAP